MEGLPEPEPWERAAAPWSRPTPVKGPPKGTPRVRGCRGNPGHPRFWLDPHPYCDSCRIGEAQAPAASRCDWSGVTCPLCVDCPRWVIDENRRKSKALAGKRASYERAKIKAKDRRSRSCSSDLPVGASASTPGDARRSRSVTKRPSKVLLDSGSESAWSPGHIPGETQTVVVDKPDEGELDELIIVEAPVPGTVEEPLAGRDGPLPVEEVHVDLTSPAPAAPSTEGVSLAQVQEMLREERRAADERSRTMQAAILASIASARQVAADEARPSTSGYHPEMPPPAAPSARARTDLAARAEKPRQRSSSPSSSEDGELPSDSGSEEERSSSEESDDEAYDGATHRATKRAPSWSSNEQPARVVVEVAAPAVHSLPAALAAVAAVTVPAACAPRVEPAAPRAKQVAPERAPEVRETAPPALTVGAPSDAEIFETAKGMIAGTLIGMGVACERRREAKAQPPQIVSLLPSQRAPPAVEYKDSTLPISPGLTRAYDVCNEALRAEATKFPLAEGYDPVAVLARNGKEATLKQGRLIPIDRDLGMRGAAHSTVYHGTAIQWGEHHQEVTPSIGQDCLNAGSGLSFIEQGVGAILGAYQEARRGDRDWESLDSIVDAITPALEQTIARAQFHCARGHCNSNLALRVANKAKLPREISEALHSCPAELANLDSFREAAESAVRDRQFADAIGNQIVLAEDGARRLISSSAGRGNAPKKSRAEARASPLDPSRLGRQGSPPPYGGKGRGRGRGRGSGPAAQEPRPGGSAAKQAAKARRSASREDGPRKKPRYRKPKKAKAPGAKPPEKGV